MKVENSTLNDKSIRSKDESKFQKLWGLSSVRSETLNCLHWGNTLVSRFGDHESKPRTGTSLSLCVLGLERECARFWDWRLFYNAFPLPGLQVRSGRI